MENIWFQSALWMALALVAAMASLWVTISAALFEIIVGAVAGNGRAGDDPLDRLHRQLRRDRADLPRRHRHRPARRQANIWVATVTIGLMGFFAPYLGCLLFARYGLGWPWPQAQIAGISLSTTSVAVVYAVMVETGYNRTELGKIILAACFVNDSAPCWRSDWSSRTTTPISSSSPSSQSPSSPRCPGSRRAASRIVGTH